MSRPAALLVGVCAAWLACAPASGEEDPARLLAWMTGSFSSAAQAATDSSYFDVRLEMVPVWTDRTDGPWLYVEQAMGTEPGRPYRQRVYRLAVSGASIESVVYAIPDPLRFAGAWRSPDPLGALSPDSLELRTGCSVFLTRHEDRYEGSTRARDCGSALRGASYATSEVSVFPDRIESWDRGFADDGSQVWGAVAGPYVFDRLPPSPDEPPVRATAGRARPD